MDLNERCPDDLLIIIFKYLDLHSRLQASLACRRWHNLLTDSRCRMENIAVLNVFERRIWENNINGGTKDRLKPVLLDSVGRLVSLADHIGQCVSLKLWFENPEFVVRTLGVLRGRGMRCSCLDLYPYGGQLPLQDVREAYPDLEALILRPHGSEYFWSGMPLGGFPNFPKLDTLVLESLTLSADVTLPSTVTQIEWSHRDAAAFGAFLDKLERCPSVKYLLIGHVEMDDATCRRLLRIIRFVLRDLVVVVFRFVKFPAIPFDVEDESASSSSSSASAGASPPPPPMIKVAKFDLCYGDMFHTVSEFVSIYGTHCHMVSINTILEERQLVNVYRLMPVLRKREVWLQLGILQRAAGPPLPAAYPIAANVNNNNGDGQQEQNQAQNGVHHDGAGENDGGGGGPNNFLRPPVELCDTLMKMDISFVDSAPLLSNLISCGVYKCLLELKFIQCKALDDACLEIISKYFCRLKRLQLSSCANCTDRGLLSFLRNWDERRSKQLCIVWRTGSSGSGISCTLQALYLTILLQRNQLLDGGKRANRTKKKLPSDGEGERITIWANGPGTNNSTKRAAGSSSSATTEKSDDDGKMLVFQDYCENELHWIIGFAVTLDEEEIVAAAAAQ